MEYTGQADGNFCSEGKFDIGICIALSKAVAALIVGCEREWSLDEVNGIFFAALTKRFFIDTLSGTRF